MMTNNIKDFWEESASKGKLSGTRDRLAKQLEIEAISKYIKDEMIILDVGCGDGETIAELINRFNITVTGLDYSEEMIKQARNKLKNIPINFMVSDIRKLRNTFHENFSGFDLIFSERCLINLQTWEEQKQAIIDIATILKPTGLYLMCENFQEGLNEINNLRSLIGLDVINLPWHNRYLRQVEIIDFVKEGRCPLELENVDHYSSSYYFFSRVINSWIAKQKGREPSYEAPVNILGTLIDPKYINIQGQGQLWVWRRK